ncbi:MAG TPA: thioredoxin domain-containing protein [Gemmatimonadales bacterium]|nr:thioredoxin domain-containing protein [Gemmatimonadales bacterium]
MKPVHVLGLLTALAAPLAAQQDKDPLAMRTRGSASAPVTVYEMSDFQCPFCKRHVDQTFPVLEREYVATGKVRWVFINYPLTSIHPNAVPAAELAMCAGRQGKFWEAHHLVFRTQKVWAPLKDPGPFLASLVDSLGLSRTAVLPCLEQGQTRKEIQTDAEGSARAGAQSTPSFYIEGGLMVGAQPIEIFRQVLDSIYRVKTGKK